MEEKQLIEELKNQWKDMWRTHVDDKERAEGIADKDYALLSVERGTVIMATRRFKLLDLYDLIQQYNRLEADKIVSSNPSVGGWRKFAKTAFASRQTERRRKQAPKVSQKSEGQQLKKGGRGWLHSKHKEA